MSLTLKDSAAWHVIEQLLKHAFGVTGSLPDDEILAICKLFKKAGGLWRNVMDGDPLHVGMLETSINNVLSANKIKRIALKIAGIV